MNPKMVKDFKYKIGETFIDNNRNLEITDRKIEVRDCHRNGKLCKKNVRMYKMKCHICGWDENWIQQSLLERKQGRYICSCCTHRIVVPGINDIATTNPNKIKYFVNKDETRSNVCGSHKKILFKCPECGDIRVRSIAEVMSENKYSCKKCGDGFSIPEKYMYNILQNNNVDFIHQLSRKIFPWCDKYYYDFYLPKYNMIIEINGIQHYYDKFYISAREQRKIDKIKKELALNNGIKEYLIIPAIFSDYEIVTKFIIRSKLFDILQIQPTEEELLLCYEGTCSSLVRIVCEDYKIDSEQKIIDLAQKYHMTRTTIRGYLKKGNMFGWCNFDKEAMDIHKKEMVKKTGYNNSKPVEVFKDQISLGIFKSATDLARHSLQLYGIQFEENKINSVCMGVYKTHKGYIFKRLSKEEYNKRNNNII